MILGVLLLGLLMVSVGLKGNENELGKQLADDLLGKQGFIAWLGGILVIGLIGYIPGLEKPSRYLLALVLVTVLVRNNGVFAQALLALQQASTAGASVGTKPTPIQVPSLGGSSSSGGGAGGALGAVGGIAKAATTIFGLF